MTTIIIHNARVYAEADYHNTWVRCDDEKITALGRGEPNDFPADARVIDAGGLHLLPGFVDVHVHGGANVDTMDAQPESLATMARFYAQHGVTSFLATTWTDSDERITAALHNAKACAGPFEGGATLRGVHLEGPYINPAKGGAQNGSLIRRSSPDEALLWLDVGVIRLVSLAPEYEENHWLIDACVERGITVSAAHTNGTYEDIVAAHGRGLSHATHTYNAMSGLHHRQPGVLGAVMSIPGITCELIADNIHVHPAAMRLLWHAKRYGNVVLVSDAMRAAGMPDGVYPVDEREITVKDGVAQLPDGTLAGSTLTMDRALKNFAAATGSALGVVYEAATLAPAEVAGIGDVTGSIAVGKDADLVLLDDAYSVRLTVALGRVVYEVD
jgi:N-acetylglucosamine-6-phosphate deacetylase